MSRHTLTERGLAWAVGIPFKPKVYPAGVAMIFPVSGRGRPHQHHIPDTKSMTAQAMLETAQWRTVSWRRGTKRSALSTLRRCPCSGRRRAAPADPRHGRPAPARRGGLGHWRASLNWRAQILSLNLPAETSLKHLAGAIKARWVCEQVHQQLKEELGLDHFEGRSWTGLHRHALMTTIAYAFLQSRRLKQAKGGKESSALHRIQAFRPCARSILNALAQPPQTRSPHCRRCISVKNLPK
ncbi:transposase [Mesorhizobium sp. M0306]|uniref:transposase n=1 Tax=Mesorhizobium sp. M0306 TaxID=2956932 RepID=UPI003335B79F